MNFSLGFGVEYIESIINVVDFEVPTPPIGLGVCPGQRSPDGWMTTYPSAKSTHLFLETPHIGCFHILIFAADISINKGVVQQFEAHLHEELSFTQRYGGGPMDAKTFSFLFITTTGREEVERSPLALVLSAEPYKMYIDTREDGGIGSLHERYGVDAQGAIVVVRPDGWVGTFVVLQNYEKLDQYFSGFLELQA